MTAQINDIFLYEDIEYDLSAIEFPGRFFSVKRLGITPMSPHTACWRGYVATFSIHKDKLVLKALDTNNGNGKAEPVAINRIMPEITKPEKLSKDYGEWRDWQYRDVNKIIRYTGRVMITDDFIQERYIHMGFQSPLSYRKVIELTFDKGKFIGGNDLSETIAKMRETHEMESRESQLARLPLWIEDCFNLGYDTKLDFGPS